MPETVQQDAPVFLQESVIIQAPLRMVYDIICDISHWPQWQSSVNRTVIDGSVEKNRSFRWLSGVISTKSVIHTMKPPYQFGWSGITMWFKSVCTWELEEEKDGVHVWVEESLNGLGASLIEGNLKSSLRLTMMELKKFAETGVPVIEPSI